jgi:hypothetical protein
MRTLQEALANAWSALNPNEPSPRYLATFLAIAATLIFAALLVGQM